MGDQDWDRSTQRFRSGWIQLENYVLLDLAGDLDPHVDLNNELIQDQILVNLKSVFWGSRWMFRPG